MLRGLTWSWKNSPIDHPCLYLVTRSLDPTGTSQTRWTRRWKPALNAFAITFGDRWPAGETY
jgi:putative transposase